MAIAHVVIMKLRKALPEQQLSGIYRQCEASLEKVPGVISASMGANFRPGTSEFTHALVIQFADRRALEVFPSHPDHVAAGELIQDIFSDFVILDYETERE